MSGSAFSSSQQYFDIIIKEIPAEKKFDAIRTIKAIRGTHCSLRHARSIAENTPIEFACGISLNEAQKIKEEFEKINVIVEIK